MRPVRGLLSIAVWVSASGASFASETVSVTFRHEGDKGEAAGALGVYVYRMPEEERILKARTDGKGALPLSLPPGDYRLVAFGFQVETRTVDFRLPRDTEALSRDGITVAPSRLSRLVGRDLPAWSVTESRGVKAGAAPADFRGKWLLVAVWGFW